MQNKSVPYYSQWESAELVGKFISREISAEADPLWHLSGAETVEEYAHWARHICGMACLKMIIEAQLGVIAPTISLAKQATQFGAYVVNNDDIKGMIYAPFAKFIEAEFDIRSRVVTSILTSDIENIMAQNAFFIASVHPFIRWPSKKAPQKGGHLVLVTGAQDGSITFHNPSGDTQNTQSNVEMDCLTFDRYFAGRGIAVLDRSKKS